MMITQKDAEFFHHPVDRAGVVAVGALEGFAGMDVGEAQPAHRRRPRHRARRRWPCREPYCKPEKAPPIHRSPPGSSSEPFQQALDVIELDLRAEPLAGAAAQLVQDLPGPLQRIQIWDLHIPLVVGTVVRHRPTERITLDRIPWCAVGGSDLVVAGIDATQAALHLLSELTRRLLQLVERLGLGRNCFAGLLPSQRLGRIAHRALGPSQRVRYVAEPVAESTHHVAEHAPQPLLLAGRIAGLSGRILRFTSLLAALTHPALLGLLLRTETAVEQLLLALHELVHSAHHLLRLTRAALRRLSRLRP